MKHRDHPIEYALLHDRTDSAPTQDTCSWSQMVDTLQAILGEGTLNLAEYKAASKAEQANQKDSVAWMPVRLWANGGRRSEDVKQVFALVLDFDQGTPFAEIRERLSKWEHVGHSTYSHSPELPRCRVVLPLASPIGSSKLAGLFDVFNAMFDDKVDVACGHDAARIYYLPRCPAGASGLFESWHGEGRLLDYDEEMGHAQAAEFISAATTAVEVPPLPPPAPRSIRFDVGFPDGERTAALTERVGHCLATGMTLEATTAKCIEWNSHNPEPLSMTKVVDTCESIATTHARRRADEGVAAEKAIEAMNAEYVWVKKMNRAFRVRFHDFVHPADLRSTYGNRFVHLVEDGQPVRRTLGDAWIKSPLRRQCMNIDYVPGKPQMVGDTLNTWPGWGCEATPGDITPWRQLLEYLIEDEHARKWVERWCAHPLQQPGSKLNSAVVLWSSRQGVGKSLLGQTVGMLYGAKNFRTITAAELHGSFNSWAKGCQFVLGEENASTDQRADANKLKHLITGETITINEKHQPTFEQRNAMNFLFTSNHPDAFHLESNDRRFFVWEVGGERQPADFYRQFVSWRDAGGLPALMHHLQHLDLEGFDPYAEAPCTKAKERMIEMGRTELERWLSDSVESGGAARAAFGRVVVSSEDIVTAYHRRFSARVTTTAVGKALIKLGLPSGDRRRILLPSGKRVWAQALAERDHWKAAGTEIWVAEYLKARTTDLDP